jgi:chromosome segregation ATPase
MAAGSAQDGIDTLTAELKALADGIAALDKSVADATEQRKQEHADYTELMAMDTQAKDILGVAKNRLNKFYNSKLYIEPKKKELTRAEAIEQTVVPAFVQIAEDDSVQPPPPPETADYAKSSQESSGVIAMIDMIAADLDKEMQESEVSEKDAQKDYETMLADAKAKRAADSTSVSQKESFKADLEEELQSHKDGKAASTNELMATAEYISGLHGECDWLADNYDARKAARSGEVDSLKNAKAVLAGADYSLVQLHDSRHLRGRA